MRSTHKETSAEPRTQPPKLLSRRTPMPQSLPQDHTKVPTPADLSSDAWEQVNCARAIASMVRQAMDDDHMDIEDCMAVIEQFCEQAMIQIEELKEHHRT